MKNELTLNDEHGFTARLIRSGEAIVDDPNGTPVKKFIGPGAFKMAVNFAIAATVGFRIAIKKREGKTE